MGQDRLIISIFQERELVLSAIFALIGRRLITHSVKSMDRKPIVTFRVVEYIFPIKTPGFAAQLHKSLAPHWSLSREVLPRKSCEIEDLFRLPVLPAEVLPDRERPETRQTPGDRLDRPRAPLRVLSCRYQESPRQCRRRLVDTFLPGSCRSVLAGQPQAAGAHHQRRFPNATPQLDARRLRQEIVDVVTTDDIAVPRRSLRRAGVMGTRGYTRWLETSSFLRSF